jgi:large subunit ribosomal protein L4e
MAEKDKSKDKDKSKPKSKKDAKAKDAEKKDKAKTQPKKQASKSTAAKTTKTTKASKTTKTTKPTKTVKTTKKPKTTKPAKSKSKSKAKVTKPVKEQKSKPKLKRPTPDVFIEGSKTVNLYTIKGKSSKKVKLPIAFDEEYRLDLIRRAVKASSANRRQPYGPSPMSGMGHSTSTWGKGRGVARVQRLVSGRRAVESPNNVGGRRAHPPTVEKVWAEKINKKERQKARRAALAALTDNDLVSNRGHKFDKKLTLPLILESGFEKIQKTKEAIEVFQKLGVYDDVLRAINGKHIRAGKGKTRGRVYKRPKSILIIALDEAEIRDGVSNLIGIDVVSPENLSIEDLAPGGDPGRLTIITEGALKLMGHW